MPASPASSAPAAEPKIGFVEKVGYGLADGATQFVFLTIVNYQASFYTDAMGISASGASWLAFFARLWDAFFDPVMGFIAARTRTRWGRFRPWLIWTCIPWAVLMVLAFTVPPFKEYWATYLYALLTNILLMAVYSMNNTPYSALMAVISGNQKQRTSLSQYRFIIAMIGQLIVGGFTLTIMNSFGTPVVQPVDLANTQLVAATQAATQPDAKLPFTLSASAATKPADKLTVNDMPAMVQYKIDKLAHDIDAWPKTMMIYAVICVVCFVLTFLTVRERIHPVDDPDLVKQSVGQKTMGMVHDLKLLKGNGPWLVMFLVTFTHYILSQSRGSAYFYYFQYVVDPHAMKAFLLQWGLPTIDAKADANTLSLGYKVLNALKLVIRSDDSNVYSVVYGLLQMTNKLCNVVGIIAASALISKFNKKFVVSISLALNTAFIIALYFVPVTNIWGIYIVEWLGQLAYAPTVPLLWVLFADVCDYTEWKYGRNISGFIYATFFFAVKSGLSIGFLIGLQVMDAFGYKANEVQSDQSKHGILLTFTLIPGIFSIACAVSMLFYQITKKQNEEIANELVLRRAARITLPPGEVDV